jgi:hypothetical protein
MEVAALGASSRQERLDIPRRTSVWRRLAHRSRLTRAVRLQDKGNVPGAYVAPRFFSAPSPGISA